MLCIKSKFILSSGNLNAKLFKNTIYIVVVVVVVGSKLFQDVSFLAQVLSQFISQKNLVILNGAIDNPYTFQSVKCYRNLLRTIAGVKFETSHYMACACFRVDHILFFKFIKKRLILNFRF